MANLAVQDPSQPFAKVLPYQTSCFIDPGVLPGRFGEIRRHQNLEQHRGSLLSGWVECDGLKDFLILNTHLIECKNRPSRGMKHLRKLEIIGFHPLAVAGQQT